MCLERKAERVSPTALRRQSLHQPANACPPAEAAFTPSAFVQEVTGVDSVCERAAVLASGGTLVVRKVAENGMTFALAKKEEAIRFE